MTRSLLRVLAIAIGAWSSVPYYAAAVAAQRNGEDYTRLALKALAFTIVAAAGIAA